VGKKTAERIALELKDRAAKIYDREDVTPLPAPAGKDKVLMEDALSALTNLGYSSKSAKLAIEKAGSVDHTMNLEGLIREALKILA
jgi:Holliday junction DNA helicase RuvA